jgi:hypothetical protein
VWETVTKKINPHIYLLKQLKRLGFKEEILINVYRTLSISVIRYSAPLLVAANEQTKSEMASHHKRVLKIIGLTPQESSINTTCR